MKAAKKLFQMIATLLILSNFTIPASSCASFNTSSPNPIETLSPDNVNDWKLLYTLGTKPIHDYALNPTKPELIYSNEDGVFLYDFVSEISSPFFKKQSSSPHRFKSCGLAYSPDGKYLAIGDSNIYIYDLSSDDYSSIKIIDKLRNRNDFSSLEFSPDSKHLVVRGSGSMSEAAACDGGGGILYSLVDLMLDSEPSLSDSSLFEERIFSELTYEVIYEKTLCTLPSYVYHTFSDDGNLVLIGPNGLHPNWNYEAVSVDINTGQELAIYTIDRHNNLKTHLSSVSQDLSYVVEVSFGYSSLPTVELKDFNTGELIKTFPYLIHHLNQTDYILSSNFQSPRHTEEFNILNTELEEVCTFKTQPYLALHYVQRSFKISNEKITAYTLGRQSIGVWDLSTCELLWEFPLLNFSSIEYPISKTGEMFFNDTFPYLDAISLETGERKFRLSSYNGESLVSNPYSNGFVYEDITNNELYVKAGERNIDVFDSLSGKRLRTISSPTNRYNSKLYITPDFENVVFRYDFFGHLYYWNIKSRKILRLTSILPGTVFQLSPDFKKIAFRTNEHLKFCDFSIPLENCIHIAPLNGYISRLFSNDFSTLLLQRDRSGKNRKNDGSGLELKLRDVETNSFLTLEPTPKLYNEEDAFYSAFAFSPTEDLLTALYKDSNSHELHVWNTKTGLFLGSFNVPKRSEELWFTPDGGKLIILADGILYIIGIPE